MNRFAELSDSVILATLDEVRKRTCGVPNDFIPAVDELVKRSVYPTQAGRLNTPLQMVKGWGAYWHRYQEPLNCPHCAADLRDLVNGPPFKREILWKDYARLNGKRLSKTICPDCRQDLAARVLPRCRVCDAMLSKRQRLYCSRRCNHRAEHARRKLREAQTLTAKLESEVVKPRLVGLGLYAEVTQAEQMSRLVVEGHREVPVSWVELIDNATPFFCERLPATPSLWQRLRKRVADAYHKLIFLVGEHADN